MTIASQAQWCRRVRAQTRRNHCAPAFPTRTETIARPRPCVGDRIGPEGATRLSVHIESGIVYQMNRTRPQPDFLDELTNAESRQNPDFRKLVDAAVNRRELLRQLVRRREALGLSQRDVAVKMGTSQPAVARLESGEVDARGSTIERFATVVGRRIEYRLVRKPRRRSAALARA